MSEPDVPTECDRHGDSHATFVCMHLVKGDALGFYCDDTSEDPRPDAWCADCDQILMADGEWNEENEKAVGISLLCANCYDEVKVRNGYG